MISQTCCVCIFLYSAVEFALDWGSDRDEEGCGGQRHIALPSPVLAVERTNTGHRVAPAET